jgi:hypothetical protein
MLSFHLRLALPSGLFLSSFRKILCAPFDEVKTSVQWAWPHWGVTSRHVTSRHVTATACSFSPSLRLHLLGDSRSKRATCLHGNRIHDAQVTRTLRLFHAQTQSRFLFTSARNTTLNQLLWIQFTSGHCVTA